MALVADRGAPGASEGTLLVVDLDARRELSRLPLGGRPEQLLVTEDGRVIVSLSDRSELVAAVPSGGPSDPLAITCRVPTAAEPTGLAMSADGEALLVAASWGGAIQRHAGGSLERGDRVAVARDPRAVAFLDEGGRRALVTHGVGSVATLLDLEGGKSREVPLSSRHDHELRELATKIDEARAKGAGARPDEAGLTALREVVVEFEDAIRDEDHQYGGRRFGAQSHALAISTDPAGRAYVPQVLVEPGSSQHRSEGYGQPHALTHVPSVAVVDTRLGAAMQSSLRLSHRMTYRSDDQAERCLLPRAVVVDEAQGSLLVACLGSDQVVRYDAFAPEPAAAETGRWRVPAGPSGLALDPFERRVVVWSRFDRRLSVISLDGKGVRAIEPAEEDDGVDLTALGQLLFHATNDARIAKDGRACASCHPGGRDDALVWSTPDGPRRTAVLAGRVAGTAPYGWDGSDPDLDAHLEEALERLGGVGGLRSLERRALVAYLRALPAPPRRGAGAPEVVRRGREIFESKQAGCGDCHAGPRLSDGKGHDVSSATRADRTKRFATPSLLAVGSRAPFFHDGRFATLEEVLASDEIEMGHRSHLAAADRAALVVYLESL